MHRKPKKMRSKWKRIIRNFTRKKQNPVCRNRIRYRKSRMKYVIRNSMIVGLDAEPFAAYNNPRASVLESADNRDLKSCALWACGFKSRHSHQRRIAVLAKDCGPVFIRYVKQMLSNKIDMCF